MEMMGVFLIHLKCQLAGMLSVKMPMRMEFRTITELLLRLKGLDIFGLVSVWWCMVVYVWWCMYAVGGACSTPPPSPPAPIISPTPPKNGSSSESDHTPEEGEFYCGGVLYTAQWCMLEYRRHKSRRSGVYLPSPAETTIQHTVVLKDWSFVALDPKRKSMHLGFKATGTLVNHPRVSDAEGRDWNSTEIRGIHSNCVVRSSNTTLYRLEGPAAPDRHQSPSSLADIMQPFCNSNWPSNAESLFAQVSKLFLLPEVPGKTSPLPSFRRTHGTTSRAKAQKTDSAATAGSRGMWCMMVNGGVCRCAVVYGGVYSHNLITPRAKAQKPDSAASAGSRGMWCMMCGVVWWCMVVYDGVYNHILMILKAAAAAVALLATTTYWSQRSLVGIST